MERSRFESLMKAIVEGVDGVLVENNISKKDLVYNGAIVYMLSGYTKDTWKNSGYTGAFLVEYDVKGFRLAINARINDDYEFAGTVFTSPSDLKGVSFHAFQLDKELVEEFIDALGSLENKRSYSSNVALTLRQLEDEVYE